MIDFGQLCLAQNLKSKYHKRAARTSLAVPAHIAWSTPPRTDASGFGTGGIFSTMTQVVTLGTKVAILALCKSYIKYLGFTSSDRSALKYC